MMETEQLVKKGIEAIEKGDTVAALSIFERVILTDSSPTTRSYLAYCMAKERGQFKKAISMCEETVKEDPHNSVHYLNLGRVYQLMGQKMDAMKIYRDGLTHEENPAIIKDLIELGVRKPPVIPFLKRDNPINKYLGLILSRLGLR